MTYPSTTTAAGAARIRSDEFAQFQRLMHDVAGVWLAPAKAVLVAGRLGRRLQVCGVASFGEYFRLIDRDATERQTAIDLLTTNETHFFREPRHFDFLREQVLAPWPPGRPLRVWSAAASSGQEPYTLAMVLALALGDAPWDVLGSDLSTRMLERARSALYDLALTREIPEPYLRACCLRGVGSLEGSFAIAPEIVRRLRFAQINLNETLPEIGEFDVVFLRNVMIYFREETKREVVARVVARLRRGGWLFVGHSESLNGLSGGLKARAPSVYQKV